jgi:hypothetical protein
MAAKPVSAALIDQEVLDVLDKFHKDPGFPQPTDLLWNIGIGPNALSVH